MTNIYMPLVDASDNKGWSSRMYLMFLPSEWLNRKLTTYLRVDKLAIN